MTAIPRFRFTPRSGRESDRPSDNFIKKYQGPEAGPARKVAYWLEPPRRGSKRRLTPDEWNWVEAFDIADTNGDIEPLINLLCPGGLPERGDPTKRLHMLTDPRRAAPPITPFVRRLLADYLYRHRAKPGRGRARKPIYRITEAEFQVWVRWINRCFYTLRWSRRKF
jgi:hypothetical protein